MSMLTEKATPRRRLSAAATDRSSIASTDDASIATAVKLREAQEQSARLRRQVQLLEMELLLRGSESRASLTGLLSSLELRDSFRLSDPASDSAFFADGGGDAEPEAEELAVLGNESFFVEKLIDPNELTDDEDEEDHANNSEGDNAKLRTLHERDDCEDCEQLQRELSTARATEVHMRDAIAALEAQLQRHERPEREDKRGGDDAAAGQRATQVAEEARAALALLRAESEQRIQRLEFDHVELQTRAAAAQQKIDALEAELAHARALSQHQKELLGAGESRRKDEEELLLESGGVASEDRLHSGQSGWALKQLLQRRGRGWGRSEAAVALVALVLVCVTLASVMPSIFGGY